MAIKQREYNLIATKNINIPIFIHALKKQQTIKLRKRFKNLPFLGKSETQNACKRELTQEMYIRRSWVQSNILIKM